MKRLEQVISIQVKTKLRVIFKLVSKDLKNSVIKIMEVYQREKKFNSAPIHSKLYTLVVNIIKTSSVYYVSL